jgi:hypothetical protein
MPAPDRNPYVILGVDYGCSLDEARRGFVRAVRRVRSAAAPQFSEEDVTWALHAVEQVVRDPDSSVDAYRIPSDPSVFRVDNAEGLFDARPIPISRRTPPLSDAEFERLMRSELAAVVRLCAGNLRGLDLTPPIPYGGDGARIHEAAKTD